MSASGPDNHRLTDVAYWDGVHAVEDEAWSRSASATDTERVPAHPGMRLKARLKRLLGPRLASFTGAYDHYLFWDVILPAYLRTRAGASVVEIGSAPGDFVLELSRRFGLVPYGIEYSRPGAELNRRLFAGHGVDPRNLIEGDFFDSAIQERYRESFDVVLSRGFIEHFGDVPKVVRGHLNLLRPGGLLIVNIPNLRGVNHALAWLFHRAVVALHNLDIMDLGRFAALFPDSELERLFCGYYGTFSFYLFNARPGSLMRRPLAACMQAQKLLNALFRLALKDHGAENRWFSPNLLFVGVKRQAAGMGDA